MLVASSAALLLLLLLALAASPAAANPAPDCRQQVTAYLLNACKCGWPLIQDSSEQQAKKKYASGCPAGLDYKPQEQFMDLTNICLVLAGLRGPPRLVADSTTNINFNVALCTASLVELCNLGFEVAGAGTSVLLFSKLRAKNRSPKPNQGCRSCESLAKLLARRVCNPEECLCTLVTLPVERPCESDAAIRVQLTGFGPGVAGYLLPNNLPAVPFAGAPGCDCFEQPKCDPDGSTGGGGGPIIIGPGPFPPPLSSDVAAGGK